MTLDRNKRKFAYMKATKAEARIAKALVFAMRPLKAPEYRNFSEMIGKLGGVIPLGPEEFDPKVCSPTEFNFGYSVKLLSFNENEKQSLLEIVNEFHVVGPISLKQLNNRLKKLPNPFFLYFLTYEKMIEVKKRLTEINASFEVY